MLGCQAVALPSTEQIVEKEEVEFPACATLWQGNYIRWQHLTFFMYIVQLYKEDRGILRMLGCRAVALPGTKQIVRYATLSLQLRYLFNESNFCCVANY